MGYADRIVDPAAEHGMVSLLLQNPNMVVEAALQVGEDDFDVPAAKSLFALIKHLSSEGQPLDPFRIMTEARQHDHIYRAIGGEQGFGHIESLKIADVDTGSFGEFVESIKKHSVARQIIAGSEQLRQKVFDGYQEMSSDQLLNMASQFGLDLSLSNHINDKSTRHLAEGLELLTDGSAEDAVETIGLQTLYPSLDKITLGLQPAECYTFVGRPGEGKSAFLKCLGTRLGIIQSYPVYYIDTEMTTMSQQWRILAELSGVPEVVIKTKQHLTRPDWKAKVDKAREAIRAGGFYHAEVEDFTIEQIVNLSRQAVMALGAKAIVFDYIKLPDSGSADKEHVFLGSLTSALKNTIAKGLGVPVITAAQTKQDDPFAIADSDRIKRYSTFVAVWAKNDGKAKDRGTHKLFITKNRFGPNNIAVYFDFNMPYLSITEGKNGHLDGSTGMELDIDESTNADSGGKDQSQSSNRPANGALRNKEPKQQVMSVS